MRVEVGRERAGDAAASHGNATIGEVLALLKPEFPDVSISKIRFLESQGLVEPERTTSGYRKFSGADVERLRFVLRDQRDRFLPLKVIKQRLDQWESGDLADESALDDVAPPADEHVDAAKTASATAVRRFDRRGLAGASGLAESRIVELEKYGLIEPQRAGHDLLFDEADLVVAKIARGFLRYGVEARHMRMFRQAVDRETDLFEQIVSPMSAQRAPEARRQALRTFAELAVLAKKMHQALLAQALRQRKGQVN